MKLAKAGYYGGDPDKILSAPLATVLSIMHYEDFTHDVERAYRELNDEAAK